MKKILVSLVVFLFASVTFAAADTLAEAAKKEKERRAKIAKPARVITNQDIEDFKAKGGLTAGTMEFSTEGTSTEETSATASGEEEKTSDEKDEEAWTKKTEAAQKKIEDLEKKVSDLESGANSRALNRGVDMLTGTAANEQSNLDKAREELEAARQGMEDLQEEARKAGVPPGWVENQ